MGTLSKGLMPTRIDMDGICWVTFRYKDNLYSSLGLVSIGFGVLNPSLQAFGKGIALMERMGVGMFLSIIAIVIAALVERKRLDISQRTKTLPGYDPKPYS
ncbi:unnamed protein product [Arabis nemorensis]|uniref:Uncharacterized protein n=1 Tax=Arabis nemorensis TaxID=586526 RepID=A0A565CL75_9BRAS|nr:unnamed protein product [Arabis nemorensis]